MKLRRRKFAVGEDFEAQFFLLGENAPDVMVFELAQAPGICRGVAPGFQQFRRTKKTADVVGSIERGHDLSYSFSPFRYSRNGPPRSSRFRANSTVAFRNPSLSPVS